MHNFTVREAKRHDVNTIVLLWKEMMDFHGQYDSRFTFAYNAPREFEKHLLSVMRSRDARVFVADNGGAAVGYISVEVHNRKPIYPIGRYGFVSDISVTESWRRCGVGRALAETGAAWLRQEGVTVIELFAAENNPTSMAFWKSIGFTDYLRLLRYDVAE